MYRILASKNGMTFTDPTPDENSLAENIYRALVPDVISLSFENAISQLTGNSEGKICYVNTMSSFIAGALGFSIKDNGSSIVPDTSSEAKHVDLLNNPEVDVKREYFNAAPHSIESDADKIVLMSIASDAILALEIIAKLGGFGAATAGKIAIAIPAAYSLSLMFIPAAAAGFPDLGESHTLLLYYSELDTMKMAKKTFSPLGKGTSSYTPYLMEDFLYERPFVNLALSDLHTLDTIQNAELRANMVLRDYLVKLGDSLARLPKSERVDIDTLLIQKNCLIPKKNPLQI